MNIENQLIFFFSALGAFNGVFLSAYFAISKDKKRSSNYFLALLILLISIRIIKSVFFYFNPKLSNTFIQIGLSACILIGPFLFLYLKNYTTKQTVYWKIHTIPFLIGISVLGIIYPYIKHQVIWSNWIVKGIYLQWLVYLLMSFPLTMPSIKNYKTKERLRNNDVWILSIYFGVFSIWLAFSVGAYTSYIVGGLSFSFILYLILLILLFKSTKQTTIFEEKEKYHNKEIEEGLLITIENKLPHIISNELFLKPSISLDKVAKELNVPKHTLSQYLNERLKKSFSIFMNEIRIEKAKELLKTKTHITVESIGYECGFNSKSTFFTAFKKITGHTPSEYRKKIQF